MLFRSKEFRKTLVDQIAQDTSGRSLGPILGRLDRAIELYSLSTMLYPSDEAKNSASGSEQQSGEQQSRERLDAAVAAHPKSLWWLYRIARTEQSSKSLWNDALGKYRQMAAGVPDGSEPWLEARARTVCLLRSQGETQKADQLKDLVFATYPKSDAEWKKRFEGSND